MILVFCPIPQEISKPLFQTHRGLQAATIIIEETYFF
jgi:hypothetical protein